MLLTYVATKKLNKLDDRKNFQFKKGNRDQKRKACKQVRDQKVWKQVKNVAQ